MSLSIGEVCGVGRIPYSQPHNMKAVAIGMPSGVDFKQPSLYKADQLRLVYNGLSTFHFLPLCTANTGGPAEPHLDVASENEII